MYQRIDEKVAVAGVYNHSTFLPKKFQWGPKTYTVEKITLISDIREGDIRKRLYSVLSQGTLYRLLFNRNTENWNLEEIWLE